MGNVVDDVAVTVCGSTAQRHVIARWIPASSRASPDVATRQCVPEAPALLREAGRQHAAPTQVVLASMQERASFSQRPGRGRGRGRGRGEEAPLQQLICRLGERERGRQQVEPSSRGWINRVGRRGCNHWTRLISGQIIWLRSISPITKDAFR